MPPTKKDQEFYDKEPQVIGPRYYVRVTPDQVRGLVRTFSIHYGLEVPEVTFKGRIRHICYWAKPHLSFVEQNVTLGVVIHEFAHYVERGNPKTRGHTPQLMARILEIWRLYDPAFSPAQDAGWLAQKSLVSLTSF